MPFHRFEEYENVLLTPHLSTAEAPIIEGKYLYYCLNQKRAGTGSELHYHPNELLIFPVLGKINAVVGKDRRVVDQGTFVLVPPNARHSMKATEDGPLAYLYIKDQTWGVVGVAEDEALPDEAPTMEYSQKIVDTGEHDKKKEGESQAIVDGIPNCYYPLLESLDAPFRAGTSITWIEGVRSAFGLYELPNGHSESHDCSEHEQFYYVLEGSMDFSVGNDSKQVTTGDIIEIPKGSTYKFTASKEDPVRFAAVRSNDHLEDLIDNQDVKVA
ncbi:cupin domain-containing protein [Alphaproteobacteria bacterium]|jgi:mannose-6-phosphate isomerase-like protein (cupin superfamily)|nr:cupin domain-containing protein [Alphaproteobacteria bacterium]